MATPRVSSWPLPEGVTSATVNGYDMAYVERGAGVAVVFVHGSALDYRYFSPQMEPFGEHHRAIAVSLRHCYPEPWRGDGEFSLDQHALDVTTFIRQVASEPVHLVGHSRGGTVSLYATRLAPDLIRTLTFVEGGLGMQPSHPRNRPYATCGDRAVQAMAARLASGDVDGGLAGTSISSSGPARGTRCRGAQGILSRQCLDSRCGLPVHAEPVFLRRCVGTRYAGAVARRDSSPPQFGAILDRLQPCLRRAERAVVANASHGMSRSNSAEFNAAVLEFLPSTDLADFVCHDQNCSGQMKSQTRL